MNKPTNPFNIVVKDLGNGNELHLIKIENIDESLKKTIDTYLVKICEGNTDTDLSLVKKRLSQFLSTKVDSTIEMGAIAEFFIHLYLNELSFKPQFLFLNLEEGSIKKGFDGYYLYLDNEWIVESKSGNITTTGITHPKKIKESYKDLKDKLAGGSANNPWQNAYNHAAHTDVGSEKSLLKILKSFSTDYLNKTYHEIKEFNIIPGSTIYLDGSWIDPDADILHTEIQSLISSFEYKNIKILCITKKSLDIFKDYLINS